MFEPFLFLVLITQQMFVVYTTFWSAFIFSIIIYNQKIVFKLFSLAIVCYILFITPIILPGFILGEIIGYLYCKLSYYNRAEYDGRWRSNWLRSLRIWRLFHLYFGINLINTEELFSKKNRGFVLAGFPHGFGPTTAFFCMGHGGVLQMDLVIAISFIMFYIPIVREIALLFGCVNANKSVFEHFHSKNIPIALMPGGARELALSSTDGINLYLGHVGFLHHTYNSQSSIIPIFSKGENRIFYVFNWFKRLRNLSLRLFSYPFPMFVIGPFPIDLTLCVGHELKASEYSSIEEYKKAYFAEMKRLIITHETFPVPPQTLEKLDLLC